MDFTVIGAGGSMAISIEPQTLVIAGWTGRDTASLEAHIEELAAMGVARPKAVPTFYRVAPSLLTQAERIAVAGRGGSGEVEAVLWKQGGALYVGVGSDHTDRALEAHGVTWSKQACAKPVSPTLWAWADLADHWDEVVLRSTVEGGAIYQEGPTTALRHPSDLWALYKEREGPLADGSVMFCGTLPAHGIRFADEMVLELADPVLGRTIRHVYGVDAVPIVEA